MSSPRTEQSTPPGPGEVERHQGDAAPAPAVATVFPGDSRLARLMRTRDWSQTPLGPLAGWSQSLRTTVTILLANRFPLLLWWGPDQCQLYNDAYRPVLGSKHPRSLGQPARDCWPEIWHIIGPLILTPYHGGPATWDDDLSLVIDRHGFPEETHFTVAYSPVPDDSAPNGVGGVLATVHEITEQVVQARRVTALRDLGARSSEAKSAEEACRIAAEAFARCPKDVPFALLYLLDAEGQLAHLAGVAGVAEGAPASPLSVDLRNASGTAAWPLSDVVRSEAPRIVEGLGERFGAVPAGPWPDPPRQALVLPIPSNVQHRLAGLLVLGISSQLELDDLYRGFCELATAQVATAIANAQAYEQERKRAEALAELDRAKTTFFSNVSHEFRTPLTLMLGPVEDLLAGAAGELAPRQREELAVAHRNSLRLLRLVNTLLDFSRIEAGRVQADYTLSDLPALTADLASTFRSAIERAGLRLVVDCPPLPDGVEVYVDRDMWEKIVLNLLSNALKFTFAGEIAIALRPGDDRRAVTLTVRDTGTGIPEDELPRLFERFHRIQGARARTHEGTGIGLALIHELARLHGGSVGVESSVDRGTTFTVTLPTGKAHLPAERIGAARTLVSTALGAAPFVEEALRWLPDHTGEPSEPRGEDESVASLASLGLRAREESAGEPAGAVARVLLADDNADMRAYVTRLLSGHYAVETVANGAAALAAARARRPDLVLADVMMPRMDGFALLRALREDPGTRAIPIILLSARAGEEATVEGIAAGADDYLVKPFAARELLARVATHLELARVRAEAAESERAARLRAVALAAENARLYQEAHEQTQVHVSLNAALRALAEERYRAGEAAEKERGRLQALFMQAPAIIGVLRGPEHVYELVNARYLQTIGHRDILGKPIREALPELAGQGIYELLDQVYATGQPYVGNEQRVQVDRRGDGTLDEVFYTFVYQPLRDEQGAVDGIFVHAVDVTEHVRAREAVQESERRFRSIFDQVVVGIAQTDLDGRFVLVNDRYCEIVGRPMAELLAGVRMQDITHPDDLPHNLELFERLVRQGTTFIIQKRYVRPDGSTVWVRDHVSRMAGPDDAHPYAIAVSLDITALKRAEEERAALLLRERLARAEAEASVRTRDEFLAAAAHDLRTPLTAIKGTAQLLRRQLARAANGDSSLREGLATVEATATQMSDQLQELLDLARLQAGQRLELRQRPTDLVALARQCAATQQQSTERHHIRVATAETALVGAWDEARLGRMLSNLLSNAVKYSPAGGEVTVAVAREPDAAGPHAVLTVQDHGIGIPAADLPHVFKRFYRASNVAGHLVGTGLGLAGARQVIEQHGGTIAVESREGEGALVTVRLPL